MSLGHPGVGPDLQSWINVSEYIMKQVNPKEVWDCGAGVATMEDIAKTFPVLPSGHGIAGPIWKQRTVRAWHKSMIEPYAHRQLPPLPPNLHWLKHEIISEAKSLIKSIEEKLPDGQERATAVTKIREAMFWVSNLAH